MWPFVWKGLAVSWIQHLTFSVDTFKFWSFTLYILLCSLSPNTSIPHFFLWRKARCDIWDEKESSHCHFFSFYKKRSRTFFSPTHKIFLQQLEPLNPKKPSTTYTKWLEWLPPPSWDFNLWTRILITFMNIIKLICKDKTKSKNLLQTRTCLQLIQATKNPHF